MAFPACAMIELVLPSWQPISTTTESDCIRQHRLYRAAHSVSLNAVGLDTVRVRAMTSSKLGLFIQISRNALDLIRS